VGHDIGQDFDNHDGWRMYHGDIVPGFPQHPHRGFETVTIVRKGYIDHSDSLGAAARFGMGDVQWLTAGAGVVHSEMFPLLDRNGPNTLELFQIWLNLPAKNKLAAPYFTMFWDRDIPRRRYPGVEVTVIAWRARRCAADRATAALMAASDDADVAIWSIAMEPGATWVVPPARNADSNRALHLFAGKGIKVGDRVIDGPSMIRVYPNQPIPLEAVNGAVEILLLQGRPIGEPVAQYGPFVMNTRAELEQAFADYRVRCSAAGRGPRTRRCTRATRVASRSTRTGDSRKCSYPCVAAFCSSLRTA
jgi:redox-sensitive bicupin YhaK (pirin superfamily)